MNARFKIQGLPDGWLKVGAIGDVPLAVNGWKPQEGEARVPYEGEEEDVVFIPPGRFTLQSAADTWELVWTGSTLTGMNEDITFGDMN